MKKSNEQFQNQDEYIKNKLQNDEISDQALFDKITDSFQNSKVKVSSFSYKKQFILVIILILLIVVILMFFANQYFDIFSGSSTPKTGISVENTVNNKINNPGKLTIPDNINNSQIENTIANNTVNIEDENIINNNAANATEVILPSNTSVLGNTQVSNTVSSESQVSSNLPIKTEDLTNFVSDFAIGIERLSFTNETLESNTLLLYIAKHYFDTNNNKSLTIDAKYAATVNNIHQYLTEFTGKDYTKMDYIRSYNNYVGYTSASNAYVSGKDLGILSKEKYKVSDVEITNEFDDVYTATAKVTRTLDDEETNYKITFSFSINQNYTYQQFCLKSLKASNLSFFPDNTVHLVDVSN